jgi:hypothetical protein
MRGGYPSRSRGVWEVWREGEKPSINSNRFSSAPEAPVAPVAPVAPPPPCTLQYLLITDVQTRYIASLITDN